MSFSRDKYKNEVVDTMFKSRGYKNRMQVPRVRKVVINLGVNSNWPKEALEEAVNEVSAITGQKPVVTKSKKSISNFKLREGQPCGVTVTLRGHRMYDFLDRFINIAPIVASLAAEYGMSAVLISDLPTSEEGPDYWTASTDQVIVTKNRELLEAEPIKSVATPIEVPAGFRAWTDDFNNLLRVLK